jgi:hypothetical protein
MNEFASFDFKNAAGLNKPSVGGIATTENAIIIAPKNRSER